MLSYVSAKVHMRTQSRCHKKDAFVKLATFFISKSKSFRKKKEHLILIEYSKQRQCYLGDFKQLFTNKNFCMKARFCNIFRIINTATLNNFILERNFFNRE